MSITHPAPRPLTRPNPEPDSGPHGHTETAADPVSHDLAPAAVAMVLVIAALGGAAAFVTWIASSVISSFFG